jgi:hypothetical protein
MLRPLFALALLLVTACGCAVDRERLVEERRDDAKRFLAAREGSLNFTPARTNDLYNNQILR